MNQWESVSLCISFTPSQASAVKEKDKCVLTCVSRDGPCDGLSDLRPDRSEDPG